MRNISFSLTTPQFVNGSKDVTRRLGWGFVKPGDHLMGCEKCQGIKPGELVRLGEIVVVTELWEPLCRMIDEPEYGAVECRREGFPNYTPEQFVAMFCKHMTVKPSRLLHRLEFKHVLPAATIFDAGEK